MQGLGRPSWRWSPHGKEGPEFHQKKEARESTAHWAVVFGIRGLWLSRASRDCVHRDVGCQWKIVVVEAFLTQAGEGEASDRGLLQDEAGTGEGGSDEQGWRRGTRLRGLGSSRPQNVGDGTKSKDGTPREWGCGDQGGLSSYKLCCLTTGQDCRVSVRFRNQGSLETLVRNWLERCHTRISVG